MIKAEEIRAIQENKKQRARAASIAAVQVIVDDVFAKDLAYQAAHSTKTYAEYTMPFCPENAEILRDIMGKYGYNVHIQTIGPLSCFIRISW